MGVACEGGEGGREEEEEGVQGTFVQPQVSLDGRGIQCDGLIPLTLCSILPHTGLGEGPTVTVAATTRCTPPAEVQNFVFVSIPSGLSYMYTWDPPVGNYDSLQYQVSIGA